jgi:hypothetical protein
MEAGPGGEGINGVQLFLQAGSKSVQFYTDTKRFGDRGDFLFPVRICKNPIWITIRPDGNVLQEQMDR